MPITPFSDEEYHSHFLNDITCNKNALQQALDIRKYEIDHYWKRATYFWTFIAATLAGFIAIQTSSSPSKTDLSVLLCSLGIVFSFGWLCVNRGSKYWQENWEKHVDMLEDNVTGPLYKVVLSRSKPRGIKEFSVHLLSGPSPISVSKINQIISLFITIIWLGLLFYCLPPFDTKAAINYFYVFLIVMTFITCIGFVTIARTYSGGYWHTATIRTSSINNQRQE